MPYLGYAQYKTWGGSLDEQAFNLFVFDASVKIDYYTFNRLKNDTEYSENVKMCCFKLIDILYNQSLYTNVLNPIVSGRSNDGVSESYAIPTAENTEKVTASKISNCVREYLSGQENSSGELLLYRGNYE